MLPRYLGTTRIRIGYPCLNYALKCRNNHTFRLKSYTTTKFTETVRKNLSCLKKILKYNLNNKILFFRITSDLIPFASHPICKINWQKKFKKEFLEIGNFIKKHKIRVSFHPGQYTVLNSNKKTVVEKAIAELKYHNQIFNLMKLNKKHKIQIHVGGVYNNKPKSILRFIKNYQNLPDNIKQRLVIENDDRSYSFKNCLQISQKINIPIVFDTLHHQILNNGETVLECLKKTNKTWNREDGAMIIDYSTQKKNKKPGSHTEHIDKKDFKKFLIQLIKLKAPADIMLEIKDKQKSALAANKTLYSLFN